MTKPAKTAAGSFALLLAGQSVSQLGTSMTSFALVIWAYTQNGQVMASSLLATCGTIPYLVVSLVGGAVVDNGNKKQIMLLCDGIAAAGSLAVFLCWSHGLLRLWVLCLVNMVSGFMNAFQTPASQVAVSLLVAPKDYTRVGGIQSAVGSAVNLLAPILAAALLGMGGLGWILSIDLGTFLFAFTTLLLFVRIPDSVEGENEASVPEIVQSIREGISFLKTERGILVLLLMYSVLELVGAVSFDSMYSPFLLARTGNHEMAVGTVSACMAAGCVAASGMLAVMRPPKKKLPILYFGSFLCLAGITLFGMGRDLYQWCAIALLGCFGAPIYSTYQTVLLREKVPVDMQGRVFSLQGMTTGMLTPIGYLLGAVLAGQVFEPFMCKKGTIQPFLSVLVGTGKGSGIGLIFVIAGIVGMILLALLSRDKRIKALEPEHPTP